MAARVEADPVAAALVGDQFTDIECAHSAGVASIGCVNRPGKRERMAQIHAGAVVSSMADPALAIRAYPKGLEITCNPS
jgi:phosphoglycolate phosphatase-like HAD superfamily hydrolase